MVASARKNCGQRRVHASRYMAAVTKSSRASQRSSASIKLLSSSLALVCMQKRGIPSWNTVSPLSRPMGKIS